MISHISGDLFTTVSSIKKPILAHSCNCLGFWGGGIALQFKKHYPAAFKKYESHCLNSINPGDLLGTCLIIPQNDCIIACLFTSIDGSPDIEGIIKNTELAMVDLQLKCHSNHQILMPKINSGIFGVPWEQTEKILNQLNMDITVYTP